MCQCAVVADDLTGANATGVLLKQMNYNAITVLNESNLTQELNHSCDCILIPTDSRAVSPKEAYDRVQSSTKLLKSEDVKVYSKRIDSTLRGNLGSEIDAMLDCFDDERVAVVVPTFPESGRVVIGGYMLVNGVPLHKTDIAIDPKTPVHDSEVLKLLTQQSKYKADAIFLKSYMNGKHKLSEIMQEKVKAGNRILSFDAVSHEDLEMIADALITSKIKFIAVDPGAFTATISRKLITPYKQTEKSRILVVVGSVHPATSAQLEDLWLSQRTNKVIVNTAELLEDKNGGREKEIARVIYEVMKNFQKFTVTTVTGDGLEPSHRINFDSYLSKMGCTVEYISNMITSGFAEITEKILKSSSEFKGLYSSGGDITVAVCKRLQTSGIRLVSEVLPLAAGGIFTDGEFKGLQIVTKGGSQGNRDAIIKCLNYLKEKLYI